MKQNPNPTIQETNDTTSHQDQSDSSLSSFGINVKQVTLPTLPRDPNEIPQHVEITDTWSVISDITMDEALLLGSNVITDDSLIFEENTFSNGDDDKSILVAEGQKANLTETTTPQKIEPSIKVSISRIVQSDVYYTRIHPKEAAKTKDMILLSPSYSYKLSDNSPDISCSPPKLVIAVPSNSSFDYSRDLHRILCESLERSNTHLNNNGETILNDDEVGFAIMAAVKFDNFSSSKKVLVENTYSAIKSAGSLDLTHDAEKFFERASLLSQNFRECAKENGVYSGYRNTNSLDMTLGKIHPNFAQTFLAEKFETLTNQLDLTSVLGTPQKSVKKSAVSKLSKETKLSLYEQK